MWVPRPDTAEDEYKVMELLRFAVARTRTRLFVFVSSPPPLSSPSPAAEADARANRHALLSIYEDVFAVQLEAKALSLDVVVLPVLSVMGLEGSAALLLHRDLEVVFTDGSRQHLVEIGDACNTRKHLGLKIVRYVTEAVALAPGEVLFEGASFAAGTSYERVVLGGSFDRLHVGHKKLLTVAAMVCTSDMTVGVTGDAMVRAKSDAGDITSFAERSGAVVAFVRLVKPGLRVHVVELLEPFGPTLTDPSLQALVVSSETRRAAVKINNERAARGLPQLAVVVTQRDNNAVVSSSFLRKVARAAAP